VRCPPCGFENPPGMRFCGNCGTALAAAPPAEERKLVTILFADVVNSTQLAGALDPERLRARMARLFEVARREIERYGGTVEKFIGDAVMAVFGLPAVHEDDPERAARAAVAIRSRLGAEADGELPEIRIGITTGEVVANPQATQKGEFLVTGEAVNLAARLQQHAAPAQILLGERTTLALRGVARVQEIASLVVKGASAPLRAWELVDVEPPHERELRPTPFVGREDELDLLASHARRMRREGRGHLITILGSGGVGKTRLSHEFRAHTADAHTLRGRALPYGTGVPFWSLAEIIREECGILFGDPLEATRDKLHAAADRLGVSNAAAALLAVLGLGLEGTAITREALFGGMRTFLLALARHAPLVLILEDVHLAEDVTLDFIEHIADSIRETPMLMLVLSRPELVERRPTWLGGRRSTTTLFLDPLGADESRELAAGIFGGKAAPESIIDLVIARTEGNPLFMEEMLRALIESGALLEQPDRWTLAVPIDRVSIPDTVHAVIAARIDGLPPAEKRMLQDAAVVGKDLWVGALRAIDESDHVSEAVGALVGKDLLVRKPISTLVGEEEFTFRHILIRDVAYAMISKAQRWPKHARHAQWLSRTAGDRQAEFADFIAHHWLQVIGLRAELGLPPDADAHHQAVTNLLLAGERATRVYANTTALDHYSRALDLSSVSEDRLRALLGRGEVWMLLGQFDRAREDFTQVRNVGRETARPRWEAIAFDHLGHSYRRQDQTTLALEHLQRGLALSKEIGDPILTSRILNHIGFTYFTDGRHEQALKAHTEARLLLEGQGHQPQSVGDFAESLHGLGENLHFLGRFWEAIPQLKASIEVSERVANRSLAAENRYMIAYAQLIQGEYADGQREIEHSLATLEEIGDVWNQSAGSMVASRIAAALGQFGDALAYASVGAALGRQLGVSRFVTYNLIGTGIVQRELEDLHGAWQVDSEACNLARHATGSWFPQALAALARDAVALGRVDDALACIRDARAELARSQTRVDFPEDVAHAVGVVLLGQGKPAEAANAGRALLEMVEASGNAHWTTPALLLIADAAAALGNWEDARQNYARAVEDAEDRGHTPALWRALAGLAEAQRSMGQVEAAAASARRAREIIERLAATVPDERLRATFLQSARVLRVITLAGA